MISVKFHLAYVQKNPAAVQSRSSAGVNLMAPTAGVYRCSSIDLQTPTLIYIKQGPLYPSREPVINFVFRQVRVGNSVGSHPWGRYTPLMQSCGPSGLRAPAAAAELRAATGWLRSGRGSSAALQHRARRFIPFRWGRRPPATVPLCFRALAASQLPVLYHGTQNPAGIGRCRCNRGRQPGSWNCVKVM